MFDCKVCLVKDQRINDLLRQVSQLERLVFPSAAKRALPVIQVSDLEPTAGEPMPYEESEEDAIDRERDAILNGTYE